MTYAVQSSALDAGRYELRLTGRVYGSAATELRATLDAAVTARAQTIVVDATDLDTIDAMAVHVFVDVLKILRPRGGNIVFFGLRPTPRRLFDITGFDRVVAVVESRDDALRAVA